MLEGYAEYYSAELSQKIHRGQKENALKGRNNGGGIPLGYGMQMCETNNFDCFAHFNTMGLKWGTQAALTDAGTRLLGFGITVALCRFLW
jgi:hypothetical protein